MEMRTSLSTAHRQAHAIAQALVAVARSRRSGRLQVALKRLLLRIVVVGFAVFAAVPAASAHAITMTKPEKQLMTLVNHMRAKHHLHQLTPARWCAAATSATAPPAASRSAPG
jgi:hypothetical protein